MICTRSSGLALPVSDSSAREREAPGGRETATASVGLGASLGSELAACGILAGRSTLRPSIGFPVCNTGGLDELASQAPSSVNAPLGRKGCAFQFPLGYMFMIVSKAFYRRFPHTLYLHEVCGL